MANILPILHYSRCDTLFCSPYSALKADEKVRNSIITDKDKVYAFVSEESKKHFDIVWLQPLGFNNTYALVMREKHAGNLEIKTISDIKNYLDKLGR